MATGYKIDDEDLETVYGVTVYKTTGLLDFPERKGEVAYDWPDEDGEEGYTDADDIVFKARNIMLHCYVRANTMESFVTKLDNFKAMLIASGTRTLVVPYLTDSFTVFYVKGSPVSMITSYGASSIMGKFIVTLREPVPARPEES